ncbi:MAG: hypothetical protein HZC40_07490 [Chloroflexi bacterium]|nr:hypothetical protein [Chloroflexota bacterium]
MQSALGGIETGWIILTQVGAPAWIALAIVVALVLYRSDARADVPLFIAAYALGYWGEWWGTTRGVWTYSNGQTPPDYLPPLWAIGLLTVTHLRALIIGRGLTRRNADKKFLSAFLRVNPRPIKIALLIAIPALAFAISAPQLAAVDWSGRLDAHFIAGIIVGIALIAYRFDLDDAFALFVCGMILGGTYEWLGTYIGEWTYITREIPPLWIIPLWGLACVAMVNLSRLFTRIAHAISVGLFKEKIKTR